MSGRDELRRRLEGTSTSAVEDARGKRGALPPAIGRLCGGGVVAGPAVTGLCDDGSVAGALDAIRTLAPGDVLVLQGPGEWAYLGELLGAEAWRGGAAAIVVDGFVRDVERLSTLGVPVFARGHCPHGGRLDGAGEAGAVLVVGREPVRPGDWLVADGDGVVVVPSAELEATAERAEEITRRETALWEGVVAGRSLFDQLG